MGKALRVALVAGEASGDLLGAHLIAALRSRLPDAVFFGIGGPAMEGQGFDPWWPMDKLSVMGYVDALKHAREITGIRRELKRRLLDLKPDVFIGIDAPDFNLALETGLKKAGIPTIHYVSPSIWAWRGGRIKTIGRAVSRVLALFPMEPPLYEKAGIPVTYVGHPFADQIPLETDRNAVREKLALPLDLPVIALLPGSRRGELEKMAATFVRTAKLICEKYLPNALFVVPLTTRETRLQFEKAIFDEQAGDVPFRLLFGHARDALGAADISLVASGTATLEAALVKRPMVITYKMAGFNYWLGKRLVLPWVSLPNVLAGRFVVPEILQDQATPKTSPRPCSSSTRTRRTRRRWPRRSPTFTCSRAKTTPKRLPTRSSHA